MLGIMKMSRWVQVEGCKVTFGNIVGGFVGSDYVYTCTTPRLASAFGRYLERNDPENPNLPIAVTDESRNQYKAKEVK